MSEEPTIKEKIDQILREAESGVLGETTKDMNDRHAEIDRLRYLCSRLETPLDLLNSKRYSLVGEMLFTTTRQTMLADGYPRRSLPIMKLDSSKLSELLTLLNKMGVLYRALLTDPMVRNIRTRERDIRKLYLTKSGSIKDVLPSHDISLVAGWMQEWTEEALENVGLGLSTNLLRLLREKDDEGIGEQVFTNINEAFVNKELRPVYESLSSALFSWSRDPEERSASQKGKGIQMLSEGNLTTRWHTAPSVFITLDTAMSASTAELLATLDLVALDSRDHRGASLGDVVRGGRDSLYIRTCPASPRPGVLPNIKADNIGAFVEGVRYLANAMSDPDHPDYDPQGELCVMKYMESDLSGVLVKGHKSMVVGLGSSGVTAGEGSNFVIPLHHNAGDSIRDEIDMVMREAPDGHEHHELELVWPKLDPIGSYGDGIDCRSIICRPGYMEADRRPVITQIRGLGRAKPELKAPATYTDQETGELVTMTIRGNVPHGVVSQAHYEDVGKGDLSDCAKLEADLKNGIIAEGQQDFVIYCPSGSTNCHAAGVANDHNLAIVYAPVHEDVTWTEVDGWVTTATGVEPAPYDPTPFTSYFFDGCRDGDRNWDYGYHTLSQFFHTFISSPYNDPRFEAYLAGFYSTWIIKATLAVALGESRHGYAIQAKFTLKAGLLPLLVLDASNCLDKFPHGPVGNKNTFYDVLRNRELGLNGIKTCLRAVRECFIDDVTWSSSYGGQKYRESVDMAIDAVDSLIELQNGGKISKVLGAVNILENAVHNCSYFFDKFVSSKTYFDIGTHNHQSLATIPQQYMTIVPLHQHFYNHVLDPSEPHKVATEASDDGIGAPSLLAQMNSSLKDSMNARQFHKHKLQTIEKLIGAPSTTNGSDIMKGDYGSRAIEHVKQITDFMSRDTVDVDIHRVGHCVLDGCSKSSCQHNTVETKYNISTDKVLVVQEVLGGASPAFGGPVLFSHVLPSDVYATYTNILIAPSGHDPVNTVFTEPTRDSANHSQPEIEDIFLSDVQPYRDSDLGLDIQGLKITGLSTTDIDFHGKPVEEGDPMFDSSVVLGAVMEKVREHMKSYNFEPESALTFLLMNTAQKGDHPLNNVFFKTLHAELLEMHNAGWIHSLTDSYYDFTACLEATPGYSSTFTLTSYLLKLWLSEQVIINDGWGVNTDHFKSKVEDNPSFVIWSPETHTEYHAGGVSAPNTVFTGHSVNQLLQVLMSIIDIDTLRDIMEEYI